MKFELDPMELKEIIHYIDFYIRVAKIVNSTSLHSIS